MKDDFTASTFTPFLRRFTDERARDLEDTKQLYARVRTLHRASDLGADDASQSVGSDIYTCIYDVVPDPARHAFCLLIDQILKLETCIFECPEIDWARAHLNLKEATDLRHFLRSKEHVHAHEERVLAELKNGIANTLGEIAESLPISSAPSPFTIPLVHTLPDARHFLDKVLGQFAQDKYRDLGVFVELFRTLYFNLCDASGIADPYNVKKPFKMPSQDKSPLDEVVQTYLKGTPFLEFFLSPIPLKFTFEERYSHMHVLGGSGAGKTTLLQNLILNDLQSDDPPSLVIVDSQGDLINKLSHLAIFDPNGGALADRLLLITPKDIKYPPAINIFDVNRDRMGGYDEAAKEQVTAGVIQTFDYLFAGLLGADLTAKQGVFFRFVARLMLALPETMGRTATILDMIALMDDPAPYKEAIASLPPIQKNFFERDFASKTFAQTKEQIRYRLNAILENPTLARLFTSPKTKIDMFDTLNKGGIVLIDTAKDFLKGASGHFGRIFISLVLQAVLERAVIPEEKRKPTFLVVDEAAAYFDSNIDDFLTETRKYKCGCVFAHQFLDQATSSLRASLAANTTIKMAGGVSMSDARALASDMRTTTDFILGQPRLHFASHIRHVTPNAVSIPVPVGQMEAMPCLSDEQHRALIERNWKRVSLLPDELREAELANSGTDQKDEPRDATDAVSPSTQGVPYIDPSAASKDW